LSFPLLQDYIAKLEEDREVELFALAFLFKGLRDEKNESWNHLADRFFKVYSDELYRCCGYEMETPGFARVWVARPDLFMVYMGAMMRAGIIEDCSFARMAGHVDRIFDMGRTTLNITGDATCALFISRLEREKAAKKAAKAAK